MHIKDSSDYTMDVPSEAQPETLPERTTPHSIQNTMRNEPSDQEVEEKGPEAIDHTGSGSQESEQDITAREFGTFAHKAYQDAVDTDFEYVDHNFEVVVTKPDGQQTRGFVDTMIDDDVIVDYKTNNMKAWSVAKAQQYGDTYGRQVSEYVHAKGMPDGVKGWIIATVPPESEAVRQAYDQAAASHDVGVKYSLSEEPDDVRAAIASAVKDSRESDESTG